MHCSMHMRMLSNGQLHRPSFTTSRPRFARLSIKAVVKVGEKAPDFELKDEVSCSISRPDSVMAQCKALPQP